MKTKSIFSVLLNSNPTEVFAMFQNKKLGMPAALYYFPIFFELEYNTEDNIFITKSEILGFKYLLLLESIVSSTQHNNSDMVSTIDYKYDILELIEKLNLCRFKIGNKNKVKIFYFFDTISVNKKKIEITYSEVFKMWLLLDVNVPIIDFQTSDEDFIAGKIIRHLAAISEYYKDISTSPINYNENGLSIEDIKNALNISICEQDDILSVIKKSGMLEKLNIKYKNGHFLFAQYNVKQNIEHAFDAGDTKTKKVIKGHKEDPQFNIEFLQAATVKGYNIEEAIEQFKKFKNHYFNNGKKIKDWVLAYDVWLDNAKKYAEKENNKKKVISKNEQYINTIFNMVFYGKPIENDSVEQDLAEKIREELSGLDVKDYHDFMSAQDKYFSKNGYFKRNMIFQSIEDYKNKKIDEVWSAFGYEDMYKYISNNIVKVFHALSSENNSNGTIRLLDIELIRGATVNSKHIFSEKQVKILEQIDINALMDFYYQNDTKYFNEYLRREMRLNLLYQNCPYS